MGSVASKASAPAVPAFTSPLVYSLISTIRTVINAARDSQAKEALRRTGNAMNSSTSPQTHRHTQINSEGRRPHTAPPPPPPPPSQSLSSLGPLIMTLKEVIPIQKILDQIELQHLGMVSPVHPHVHPPATRTSEIHYLCVVEEEDFHVGVFVLPPKARIPLHDHPGMCVLSRLLCGSLNVKDFDWCDAPSPPEQAGGGCRGRRKAQTGRQTHAQTQTERRKGSEGNDEEDDNKEGGEGHIHTHAQARKQSNYDTSSSPRLRRLRGFAKLTSSAWITRPTTLSLFKECNNIHEFEAGEDGCAILDVLIPPYDPLQGRPCNYYTPTHLPPTNTHTHKRTSPWRKDKNSLCVSKLEVGHIYRLLPSEAPEEFDVLSGTYVGPIPPLSPTSAAAAAAAAGGGEDGEIDTQTQTHTHIQKQPQGEREETTGLSPASSFSSSEGGMEESEGEEEGKR